MGFSIGVRDADYWAKQSPKFSLDFFQTNWSYHVLQNSELTEESITLTMIFSTTMWRGRIQQMLTFHFF